MICVIENPDGDTVLTFDEKDNLIFQEIHCGECGARVLRITPVMTLVKKISIHCHECGRLVEVYPMHRDRKKVREARMMQIVGARLSVFAETVGTETNEQREQVHMLSNQMIRQLVNNALDQFLLDALNEELIESDTESVAEDVKFIVSRVTELARQAATKDKRLSWMVDE